MEFDTISLKLCFCVEEEHVSGENCMEGSNSGWHNKPLHRLSYPIKIMLAWRSSCEEGSPTPSEPGSSCTTCMCQMNYCFAKKQT